MRCQGMIVEWNAQRGFGFIVQHDGNERTFAHISAFERRGVQPAVGDVVTYAPGRKDGRPRAEAIQYPGAAQLAPPRSTPRRVPGAARNHAYQRERPTGRLRSVVVLLLAVGAVGGWAVLRGRTGQGTDVPVGLAAMARPAAVARPAPAPAAFTCDGRQHCSQMHSLEEARYFVGHCPNTKMDGDHDGEPCEQQF